MAKILIVDDQKDLCEALSTILTYKKHETLVAHNGDDAISLALSEHPDLILMDIRMPGITGYDAVRKIREDAWGKNVKVLVLTASGEVDKIPSDLNITKNDYLMKATWGIENIAGKVAEKLSEPTP